MPPRQVLLLLPRASVYLLYLGPLCSEQSITLINSNVLQSCSALFNSVQNMFQSVLICSYLFQSVQINPVKFRNHCYNPALLCTTLFRICTAMRFYFVPAFSNLLQSVLVCPTLLNVVCCNMLQSIQTSPNLFKSVAICANFF